MNDDYITYIVAYWGDDRDTALIRIDEATSPENKSFSFLAKSMEMFICGGHITEILEVIHVPKDRHSNRYVSALDISDICDRWRFQLHEQGYYMNRPNFRQGETR